MEDPIRVLCVFGTLDCGGAETMCMNLYRKIDRNKVQFDFVKHSEKKGVYEDEIISLAGRIFEAPDLKKVGLFHYKKWWLNHLIAHPEHMIIHGHFFTVSKIYFSVAKSLGRITVGHCHSVNFRYGLKESARRLFYKGTEKYCDFCLACSEQSGKFFFPNRDVKIIKNGIETEKYKFNIETAGAVREEFGLNGDFVVGVVGSITEVKNPFETIRIFKEVLKREPEAKLLWLGTGTLKEQLEEKIREEHLEGKVILAGIRLDVYRVLQAMDCYIMPSLMEGLPVALIEAQAASLPCFCSDIITKEADVTGLCEYLPLKNEELWAERILAGKGKERKDMTEKIEVAGYDVSKNAKCFEHFYLEECLGK